jgi:putative ABC transport system permease protein
VLFGGQVTEGFWDAIGATPAIGRTFLPEEHVRGARRSVLISDGLWRRKFAANPAIVNQPISLDGEPWTIVGVLPPAFAPELLIRPGALDVWTPKVIQPHDMRIRGSAWWKVVARMRPGVAVEQAAAELNAISAALAREHPRTNAGVSAVVIPLREHLMGDLKRPLLLMLAAVAIVLVMACANVASLMLARGLQREREFAIRSALGAGRGRLVRQMVSESLLLAGIAAAFGVAAAHWAIQVIVAFAPSGTARLQDAAIDPRMLALSGVLTLMTALACGVVPAVQFSRSRDPLRDRGAIGSRAPLRRALVIAEIAVAVVLLTGAGLLVRSFTRLMAVDPGFSPRGVIAAQVFVSDRHGTPDRTRAFFGTALERLRVLPGVEAAGAVSAMPFMLANIDVKSPIRLGGAEAPPDGDRRAAYLTIATPGYFGAMSVPLKEGRYLEPADSERGRPVAVISEALRRREWPASSPIGGRIHAQWHGRPLVAEVVGVVGEIRHDGLDSPARPEIFLPFAQLPFTSMTFVVKGQGDSPALIAAVKREVWAVDPLQTFYDTASVEQLVRASAARQRFSATLMAGFATLALMLCATGIYGLVSFTTVQRTREIGVRMALGANGRTIGRMVLRDGGRVVLAGVAIGVAAAAAAMRALGALLFEVRPSDPATLATVSALLIAVGLAACYVPARRATRVDPLTALRAEP